jgi:hypothetical protein
MNRNLLRKWFLNWQVLLAAGLLAASGCVYSVSYLIFHDAHNLIFYFMQDLAFVFIQVLLVTLIIDRLLNLREKQAMLKKMNMAIGAFFSEVGKTLLKMFSSLDPEVNALREKLLIDPTWSTKDFRETQRRLAGYPFAVDFYRSEPNDLKNFLVEKRGFLLGLLGNPNLLEHETFTDLLGAVFHLTEELSERAKLAGLPDADKEHLDLDIQRAYRRLVFVWLEYMKHLKNNYPYLFSLAMRTNPFDENASVEIK